MSLAILRTGTLLEGSAFKSLGLLSPRWYAPLKVLVDDLLHHVQRHQSSLSVVDGHHRRLLSVAVAPAPTPDARHVVPERRSGA